MAKTKMQQSSSDDVWTEELNHYMGPLTNNFETRRKINTMINWVPTVRSGRKRDVEHFQIAKNLEGCRKAGREMEFRTEYQFSTELPFTRGNFTASVRDHNLRESSHLFYESKDSE